MRRKHVDTPPSVRHPKRRGANPSKLEKPLRDPSTKRAAAFDQYLKNVRPSHRVLLSELRETIHALVPDVEECISYGLPAFRYEGRIIAGFSATSKGCSYYPFSGTTLTTLAAAVDAYDHTKSALHFGPDKPLPATLVRKLLKARIAEKSRRRTEAKPSS